MTQPFKIKRLGWWIAAIAAFILFTFAGKLINLATDFLWFKEVGLTTIFTTSLMAKILCGLAVGVAAWVVIYANILIAEAVSARSNTYTNLVQLAIVQFFKVVPIVRAVLAGASLVVAFMLGSWASAFWDVYLKFRNAVPFGVKDPLFGKDIAFYVFQLPFLRSAFFCVVAVLLLSFAGAGIVYLLRQNLAFDGKRALIAQGPRAHLMILAGLFLGVLAFFFQFKMYSLVTAAGTIVNGAGYADIKVGIPLLGVMRWVCVAAGLLVLATIRGKSFKPLLVAVLVIFVGNIAGRGAVQMVQKFVVAPNEVVKETPYIAWSIANTRNAYGIDVVDTRHFTPTANLTADLVRGNALTTNNIRLWDQAPLLTTYSQLQEIRTYYGFLDVDNDRYDINGEQRQVMLSPRELIPANLPSRIWINEHLTYTHGYGLCLGPVNSVTPEGLPDFFIKNIPPSSTVSITVTRPEIYYGESNAGYAIVKTAAKEFDYPSSGDDNVYTVYQGSGGVRMGGLLKKALFAMRFGELKILLRGDIGPESRILFYRQILERVRKAAPFLQYDSDPYMVIANDGRLVWMLDGYTTTDAYPYSAPIKGVGNYIRNSVKVVIDAYNGSLAMYVADPGDPIINTYAKVFPGVLRPMSEMPQDIHSHIRYPQTLFTVQARVYAVYHMTDPQIFYNKEDVWRIPASVTEEQSGQMAPYYTIMKLAGVGTEEEFILMVPFCPSKKENMIAWFAARCDDPNYGKLLVFDFPKQNLVYGPSQIESRINQDPEISKQLALWNQGGSRVIRGSLLVVPVEQSLIYVQPLYLTSQGGSSQGGGGVPELKRVIVAYDNSIAMEETLDKSLMRIFGGQAGSGATMMKATTAAPTAAGAPALDTRGLITEASRQFEIGQTELKRGNWAGYGEAMKKVETILQDLGSKTR